MGLRLVCDGFIGIFERDSLRLPGYFWESGGHRVKSFNSDLKPGAAFLIAIGSPINRSGAGPDNPYICQTPAVKSVRITGHYSDGI